MALADKLDTLVGFWAIDEKPTGSGDPYQLRRAALGVIRILIENDVRVPLAARIGHHYSTQYLEKTFDDSRWADEVAEPRGCGQKTSRLLRRPAEGPPARAGRAARPHRRRVRAAGQDDLALVVKRVEALGEFLKTDDGANLLAGVKRASNILAIEEKKDKTRYEGEVRRQPADRARGARSWPRRSPRSSSTPQAAINVENFAGAMRALAELRAPVDHFFDKVTVNADNAELRVNRLKLLSEIRSATLNVADFSKIAG